MRRPLIFGLLMLTATFSFLPAHAAPPEGSGAIYLTDTVLSQATAPATVAQCGEVPTYAITAEAPTGTDAGKAYTAGSLVAISCGALFTYVATSPFQLSGTATLDLFIGCDYPTVFRSPEDAENDEVPPTSVRVSLLKNGAEISRAAWYMPAPPVCAPGDVIALELELPTDDTEFDAEDTLTLEIPVFSSNPYQAADNVHILVGSTETPSALHALGLLASAAGLESFAVVADSNAVTVKAGSAESRVFDVRNDGTADAEFAVSARSVPEDLDVSFDPSSGSVAPGESATVTMIVTAALDAQAGQQAFEILVAGVNGGNATWNITVDIQEADASGPGNGGDASPSPSPDDAEATPGTNETDDAGSAADDEGGSAPGISAAVVGLALVGALAAARRRRE